MNFSDQQHLSIKTGNEKFNSGGENLEYSLLDFWRWSISDILSNSTRGVLAEFIVAKALNVNVSHTRNEWDAYDLITSEGIKIEVKSSAYLQTWPQTKYSKISFSISTAKPWDWSVDKRSENSIRCADIYVFCLLEHLDKATINPLNLNQWKFYVLSSKQLNDEKHLQKSISLNSLKSIAKELTFEEVNEEVLLKYNQH